jgi:hypothetical protein
MNLRRAVLIAAWLAPFAAGTAMAQSPWPEPGQPAQSKPAEASPWTQQQPQSFQAPPPAMQPFQQQQQQEPPCIKEFTKLRDDAQKRAGAIQAASQREPKPTVKQACGLFNSFSAAEAKLIKYAVENAASCGIPAQAITSMKQAHAKTTEMRTNVCRAAAQGPPRPAAPSLSDALSAPVPDSNNIRTGRGTFDTLTGSPLGNR